MFLAVHSSLSLIPFLFLSIKRELCGCEYRMWVWGVGVSEGDGVSMNVSMSASM